MYEIELKVPAELAAVRDRLQSLDTESVGSVTQRDRYYDHPLRSFADTDEALRLRNEEGEGALTYKGPRIDTESKTREELEIGISDLSELDRMLDVLGFDPAGVVVKERERFRVEGYTVALDRVEGVGEFVEIETRGGEEEIDRLRSGALALLDRLGLDADATLSTSYLELHRRA